MFFFLKNYQPRVYRKILYSGMGLRTNKFNPKERPKLSKFQLTIGLSQIKRNDEMEKKRRENSQYLQSKIAHLKNIKIINNHFDQDWNHQYFVINVNKNFEKIYEKIFKEGIHVMDENVWDCSKYNFQIENKNKIFEISRKYTGLLRIQNNSKLNFKSIDNIANVIITATNEV
jgi:dTDP-4-amino-4,6-dideoxygalactose transaminase